MKIKSSFRKALIFLLLIAAIKGSVFAQSQNFIEKDSDAKAINIATDVMKASGGKKNWDATHFIAWNFFGSRKLIWDKYTGNVRIENLKNDTKILVNINNLKGRVFKNGAELTNQDSLAKYLEEGKNIWINDSYWLVMPFKMKDPGVTLKYISEDTTQKGVKADVVRLTYKGVGVTPNNAYNVWVNKKTHLVDQWAFYKEANQPKPNFVLTWDDYQPFGKIKLSGTRGERKITDIHVFTSIPDSVFTSFAPYDINNFK
jgi:plasmid maintenance system killer protein